MNNQRDDTRCRNRKSAEFDILRLSDESVSHLLYLRYIKGKSLNQLKEQFCLDSESLDHVLNGRVRKEPYRDFMKIKKHLNDTG